MVQPKIRKNKRNMNPYDFLARGRPEARIFQYQLLGFWSHQASGGTAKTSTKKRSGSGPGGRNRKSPGGGLQKVICLTRSWNFRIKWAVMSTMSGGDRHRTPHDASSRHRRPSQALNQLNEKWLRSKENWNSHRDNKRSDLTGVRQTTNSQKVCALTLMAVLHALQRSLQAREMVCPATLESWSSFRTT